VILDRLDLPRESVSLGDRASQFSFRLVEGSGGRVQALLEPFAARGLLSEPRGRLRDHIPESVDFAVVARGLAREATDEHRFEPANGRVAGGKSIA
jgi:hypothetical protein